MKTQTKEKKDASKNGATNGTATNGATTKETPVKVVKTDPKPIDINDRVQKIKEVRGLATKRDKTIETLNDLREFRFSSDDSAQLTIHDSEHRDFKTSNSNLLGMVVDHLEVLLDAKAKELEKEILNFQI